MKSKEDYPAIAKALVRSLHGPKEVQYALLSNISTLSKNHPGLFDPYLHSFYCFANDPLYIKLVKLNILGNLATETSSPTILREFQVNWVVFIIISPLHHERCMREKMSFGSAPVLS
ncbi:unnamed protein product [Echinostoma caproni]|uniref:Adaptin_N domain-containing protein n=1 Tax=Echinostoma caproni TaxID=27848 RepID=A0A183A3B0_9TREM|nr:unnamed protein product [Echinostoma caproni]